MNSDARERAVLRERNLKLSIALVHNNLGATEDELRRAVNDLGDALAALREQRCEWSEDEDANWTTACGEMFCFIEAGPVDNRMRYCCYCGAALVPVPWARREP